MSECLQCGFESFDLFDRALVSLFLSAFFLTQCFEGFLDCIFGTHSISSCKSVSICSIDVSC